MSTVTISKKEYEKLMETKLRYERLRQVMKEDIFVAPPTTNGKEALRAFRDTKK